MAAFRVELPAFAAAVKRAIGRRRYRRLVVTLRILGKHGRYPDYAQPRRRLSDAVHISTASATPPTHQERAAADNPVSY
jgi:hypothetical protein